MILKKTFRKLTKEVFGFTIIELLIVITLIGILAGIGFMVVNPAETREKAEDAIRANNLNKIISGIETYRTVEGSYPTDNDGDGNPLTSGSGSESVLSNYMDSWPLESEYYYTYNAVNDSLCISTPNKSFRYEEYNFKYVVNAPDAESVDPDCLDTTLRCYEGCSANPNIAGCFFVDKEGDCGGVSR